MCLHMGRFWSSNSGSEGKCLVYCFHTYVPLVWGSGGVPQRKFHDLNCLYNVVQYRKDVDRHELEDFGMKDTPRPPVIIDRVHTQYVNQNSLTIP